MDLTRATGSTGVGEGLTNKLSHVMQLTGFSDPVYAEAYVNVHQYDILLGINFSFFNQPCFLCRCSNRQPNQRNLTKPNPGIQYPRRP